MKKVDKEVGQKIAELINSLMVGKAMRKAAVENPKRYNYKTWNSFVLKVEKDLRNLGVPYRSAKEIHIG